MRNVRNTAEDHRDGRENGMRRDQKGHKARGTLHSRKRTEGGWRERGRGSRRMAIKGGRDAMGTGCVSRVGH